MLLTVFPYALEQDGHWSTQPFEDYIFDLEQEQGCQQEPQSSSQATESRMTLRRTYIAPSVSTWLDMIRRQASELESDAVRPAQPSADAAGGNGANARRSYLQKGNIELLSAVSQTMALVDLHQALKEGGAVLALAERLLAAAETQVKSRKAAGIQLPPSIEHELRLARQKINRFTFLPPRPTIFSNELFYPTSI